MAMIIAIMMIIPFSYVKGGVVDTTTFAQTNPVVITVFPNPVTSKTQIKGENVDLHNALIQVVNMGGKAVEVLIRQYDNGYEILFGEEIKPQILLVNIITQDGKSYVVKIFRS